VPWPKLLGRVVKWLDYPIDYVGSRDADMSLPFRRGLTDRGSGQEALAGNLVCARAAFSHGIYQTAHLGASIVKVSLNFSQFGR
jgi:hypothetical protein